MPAPKKKPAKKPTKKKTLTKIPPPTENISDAEITAEMPKTPRKSGMSHGTIIGKTKLAMRLVTEHGLDEKSALTLAGGREVTSGAVSQFRKKVRKLQLTDPSMVKLAHNVVKDVLKGKVRTFETQKVCAGIGVVDYTETVAPTFANQLAAADMVLDRDQPLINRNVNLTGSLTDFLPFAMDDLQ